MSDLKMPEINRVQIAGRLTRDAEIRNAGSVEVAELSVAVSKTWKDKSGNKQEKTAFISVQIWEPREWLISELTKGRPVLVEGELSQDTWEDRESGAKREKTRVRALRVQLLDWRDGGAQSQARPTTAATTAKPQPQPQDEDDLPF